MKEMKWCMLGVGGGSAGCRDDVLKHGAIL